MALNKVAVLLLWCAMIYFNLAETLHINQEEDGNSESEDPVVETSTGPVKGFTIKYLGSPVDIFLGIPFAKPPLDDLRFKKPVPVDPWTDTFDATKRPNSCQQERSEVFGSDFRGEQMWNPKTPVSEDCLYLNLWVPKGATSASTLIWIHGGGFSHGNSALDMYDGTILAATRKVIVASMNYRLGAFGFLYTGDVDAPGNVAFYDQALAIQWIKCNIASFGGEPETVTLFGESAGASSINALLISPVTQHLTRRAILQSGSINTPWSMATMMPETALKATQNIMKNVGCVLNGMDCMRKVDAKILSQAQWIDPIVKGFPIGPTVDGVFFPTHPIEMLNEGKFLKAEILVGTNQDEGTFFAAYDFPNYVSKDDTPSDLTREAFHEIIDTIFERHTVLERAMIVYNYTKGAVDTASVKNLEVVSKILGDYMITCPVNYMVDKFSDTGNTVYYYYFKERTDDRPWGSWMGSMHGEEIPYVFGAPLNPSLSFTKSEQDLSRRMIDYFATFAETGKPDRLEGVLSWPKYSRSDPRYVILSAHSLGQGARLRYESCSFWNDFTMKSGKQSKK